MKGVENAAPVDTEIAGDPRDDLGLDQLGAEDLERGDGRPLPDVDNQAIAVAAQPDGGKEAGVEEPAHHPRRVPFGIEQIATDKGNVAEDAVLRQVLPAPHLYVPEDELLRPGHAWRARCGEGGEGEND